MISVMENNEVNKLYKTLISKGYSPYNIGDEATFASKMADRDNRKQLYDWVSSRGDVNIGDYNSYEKLYSGVKDNLQDASSAPDGAIRPYASVQRDEPAAPTVRQNRPDTPLLDRKAEDVLKPVDNTVRQDNASVAAPVLPTAKSDDAYKRDVEERIIDSHYVQPKAEKVEDVARNYIERFRQTENGQQLGDELEEKRKEVSEAYASEFLKSPEYKALTKQYSGDRLNTKANELFKDKYSGAIDRAMQPYEEEFVKAAYDRYGNNIQKEEQVFVKKGVAERVAEMDKDIDTQLGEVKERLRPYFEDSNADYALRSDSYNRDTTAKDLYQKYLLETAKKMNGKSLRMIDEAGKKDGWINALGRGVRDEVFDFDNWLLGIADYAKNVNLEKIAEKADKGETLSKAEQALMDACLNNLATQSYYSSDLSRAYKAGQTTGASLPFMLEFAVNPLSASGSAIARGILKYGLKKFGKIATKKVSKMAARLVGDAAAAAGMTMTTGLGRVASGYKERRMGDFVYDIDNNGAIQYKGRENQQGAGEALGRSFANTFLEDQSEMIFNAFKGAGGVLLGQLEKWRPGFTKQIKNMKVADWYNQVYSNKTFRDIAERTQFHGLPEEYMEEVYNNFANVAIGEMDLKDATDLDNNIDTFLGLAPTTVAMSMIGLGGLAHQRVKSSLKGRKIERLFVDQLGEEEFERLSSLRDNKEIRDYIKGVIRSDEFTTEEKKLIIEAAYHQAEKNAEEEGRSQQTPEQNAADDAFVEGAEQDHQGNYATELSREALGKRLDAGVRGSIDTMVEDGATAAEVENLLSGLDGESAKVARSYYHALMAEEGAIENARVTVDNNMREFESSLIPLTDKSGNVTTATYKDDVVFVRSEHGDNAIIQYEDGHTEVVLTKNLKEKTVTPASDLITKQREKITAQAQEALQNRFNLHPNTRIPYQGMELWNGDTPYIIGEVRNNADDTQTIVAYPAGLNAETGKMEMKSGSAPIEMTYDEALQLQNDYYNRMDAANSQQADAQAEQPQVDNMSENKPQNESTPSGGESTVSNKDADTLSNGKQQEEQKPKLVTKRDGTPDFIASGEDASMAFLQDKYKEKTGHKIEVTKKATAEKLKKAESALFKAQQAYDDAPIGAEDKAEAALNKAKEAYDAARKEADFWNVMGKKVDADANKVKETPKKVWSASEVQNDNSAVASDSLQSEPIADNGSTSNGTPSKQKESVIWRTPNDATTFSAERQGLDYEQSNVAETTAKGSGITPQSTLSENKDSEAINNRQEADIKKDGTEQYVGRSLTESEANELLSRMEEEAEISTEQELTAEAWNKTFDKNNSIETPIGRVKMGGNQITKFFEKNREKEFGMVAPTLRNPDVIIEEKSEAKDGEAERPSSYLFVKTFNRNGEKVKFYASITVKQDGMEVSISSHYINKNRVGRAMQEGKVLYTREALLPNSSEWHLAEHQSDVPDLLPTQGNNASSENKDSKVVDNKQETEEKIAEAESETNTNPTEAQKKSGNYKKGHVKIDGHDITIEQPKGSVRRGKDQNGKEWETEMHNTYGYIRGTEGVDGDHIDVFLSDNPTEGNVYVVDQVNPETGEFDEHKVMYGFDSAEEAKAAYLSNYEKGWKGLGNITEVSKEEFKKWIDSSKRKTKPFAEYKGVKRTETNTEVSQQQLPLLDAPVDINEWMRQHPGQTPTTADLFNESQSQKQLGKELSRESNTTDKGVTLTKINYEGGYVLEARHGSDFVKQAYYPNDEVMTNPKVAISVDAEAFKKYVHFDENGLAYMKQGEILSSFMNAVESDKKNETARQQKAGKAEPRKPKPREVDGSGKIDDFGEKIAGARKDMLLDYAKSLDNANVESFVALPLSKAFKRPNLRKLVEEGALREKDARFAEAILAAYLSQGKPKQKTRSRYAAMESGNDIRKWAEKCVEGADILRTLFTIDEAERDKYIEEIRKRKAYDEGAVNERKRKLAEWNPGRKLDGTCYGINPVALFMDVYERLGYDGIGEVKLPVTGVIPDSTYASYELIASNGKKFYPSRQLKSYEDVADEIVYQAKRHNGDMDNDHPESEFLIRKADPIEEDDGYEVLALSEISGSSSPDKHYFRTKEEADAFVKDYGAKHPKGIAAVRQNRKIKGYGKHVIVYKRSEGVDNAEYTYMETGLEFASMEEARAAIGERHDELNDFANTKDAELSAKAGEVRQKKDYLRIEHYTEDGKTWKYAIVLDERYSPHKTAWNTIPYALADGFATRKDAEKYVDEHRAEWNEKIAEIDRQRRDFVYFDGDAKERLGEDYRKGQDVTAEQFATQFGFRGVQFGNWANQRDRQAALNNTFDGFMDLARLLGVSPRAISLNGELGIAFGARGSGNAAAHYERDEVVINLTKTMGAGSLAHEWWHALDNYFGRQGGVAMGMITENRGITMRKELRDAFNSLIDHVAASGYDERSAARGRSYWGTRREETARLFETWVNDELRSRGERNHFLVGKDPEAEDKIAKYNYDFYVWSLKGSSHEPMGFEEFKKTPMALSGYVYPSKEELETLGRDLHRIFDTVQERVDKETGNVVMYHRGSVVTNISPAETALRDAVIDRLRENGMEVITDVEEGQRVLEMANEGVSESRKKKSALETAELTPEGEAYTTAVSSADGAKILNNIDSLASKYEEKSSSPKTFVGDLAKALNVPDRGTSSKYATFETKGGKVVTFRISNHNATVRNFDNENESEGISIVVSGTVNNGITNNGNAHVVEYFYSEKELRRAEGKPLASIVRSIKQALYSGEFKDETGLAERQEVNAIRFFRTPSGEAYGYTVGNRIYIDPRIANTETPIHEYAHLWATALRKGNEKEWRNVVELMKGTSIWEEVKKKYPELTTEDEIADEVLAHYSGRRGAERLREEQRKALENNDVMEAATAVSAINKVRRALRAFWKGVADFLHIHYTTAEEVADRVMKDLLDGVNPTRMMDGGKSLRPDTPIRVIDSTSEHGFKSYKEAKDWAKEHIARTYSSEETGGKGEIRISNTAIDKYLSQSAVDKSDSKDVHLSVLKVLPEVIRESVDAEQHPDYKKDEKGVRSTENGTNNDVTIHRLYGAVRIGDKMYRVKVTLKENVRTKETTKAYSYEATKIELLAGQHGDVTMTSPRNSNSSITAANLLKGVEKSYGGGKFFEEESKVRLQFIGEKGAETADRADEVNTRLDNLNVAREMEANKKDAKAIKMATGWERGADGKWRYEIPDIKYHPKGDAEFNKLRDKQPWSKELDKLEDKLFDGEELTESETKHFDELAELDNKFKAEFLSRKKNSLADWVESKELFAAYPELKNVGIIFTDQLPQEEGGYYSEREKQIVVNTSSIIDTESVIAHEIQHAIQRIEGFARGGNTKESMMYLGENKAEDVKIKKQVAYKLSKENGLGLTKQEVDDLIGHLEYEDISDEELQKQIDDLCQRHNITEDRLEDIYDMGAAWHEAYRRIAGEVEARNVQNRMGMSDEERRKSLAAETEDVAREDQLFLNGSSREASESEDTRFRSEESEELEEANEKFNEQVVKLTEENADKTVLSLGRPSAVLQSAGVKDKPMKLYGNKVMKKMRKHGFALEELRDLPKAVANPITVFNNYQREGNRSILTELETKNGNFLVTLELGKDGDIDFNIVSSVFGKGFNNIVDWYNKGYATYIDKEKALSFLYHQSAPIAATAANAGQSSASLSSASQPVQQEIDKQDLSSATKIVETFDNPSVELEEINEKFNEELEQQINGKLPNGHIYKMGNPGKVLLSTGVPNLPIQMSAKRLKDKATMFDHDFDLDEVKNLVKALQEPLAVFAYGNKAKAQNIIVPLQKDGKNFIVGLSLNPTVGGRSLEINSIRNVFPKDNSEWLNWVNQGKTLFLDKEKIQTLINQQRTNLADVDYLDLDSIANVIETFENPSVADEKVSETNAPASIEDEVDHLQKIFHTPVRIVHNDTELTEDERKTVENRKRAAERRGMVPNIKGWFDPKTGEVVIYMPGTESVEDMRKTFLHEVVGHKGLRELFGAEEYDRKMTELFDRLPEEEQEKVRAAADAKYKGDMSVAMDEYLAEQAEKDELPSWWDRVVSAIRDMLHKFGFDMKLTNNDVRYLLWRSRNKLRETDLLDAAEDMTNRKKWGIGGEEKRFRDISMVGEPSLYVTERNVGAARDMYERMVSEASFKLQESYQDSMLGLKKMMEAIEKATGSRILDYENPYMAENALSSKNFAEMEAYRQLVYKPILQEVKKLMDAGVAYDDIVNYLYAKHGLERNEYMARQEAQEKFDADPNSGKTLQDFIDECREKDYSGLTALTGKEKNAEAEAEAKNMVDSMESAHNTDALWKTINASTSATLSKMHESGLIDKETYDNIKGMYKYYIPLRGWEDTTAAEEYDYLNSSHSNFSNPLIKAKGRKSKADDPIATIGNNAESAIVRGNRNLMKQKFLTMVQNHRTDLASVSDLWMEKKTAIDANGKKSEEWVAVFPDIPDDATPQQVNAIVEQFNKDMQAKKDAGEEVARRKDKPNVPYRLSPREQSEHQVVVYRGGKPYIVTVNANPRAAQAMNGATNPDAERNVILQALGKANRFMSANFTARNPGFIAANFVRDGIYANSIVRIKESSDYANDYHKEWIDTARRMSGLLKRYENGTLDMNNTTDRLFSEFIKNGGETGYTFVNSVEDYKGAIAKELKRMNSKSRQAWGKLADTMDHYGRMAEDVSRFAAYVTSRKHGRSIDRSVNDAKEISVNFNKKGSGSKMLGKNDNALVKILLTVSQFGRSGYIFWNAGVQGLTNFIRLAKNHKAAFAKMAGSFFGMGFALPMLSAAFGGDDDDYYNLPEYTRRQNICFKVPGTKEYVTIPLPVELRAIYGLGELCASVALGKEDFSTKKVLEQVSQIFPIDVMGEEGFAAFAPSYAKPIWEVHTNKSWTGLPIYKKNDFNKDMPEWTKAYKSTSPTLVELFRIANEMTGGNKYKSGFIDFNPAMVEHLVSGYLGGVGTTITQLAHGVEAIWNEDMRTVRNIPIASRFFREADERAEEKRINEVYFDNKARFDKIGRQERGFKKEMKESYRDPMEYAEWRKKYNDLIKTDKYKKYLQFKAQDKALKKWQDAYNLTGDEETERRIFEMKAEMNRMAK